MRLATNVSTKYDRLKNPNWREADQLAIYKHDQEVETMAYREATPTKRSNEERDLNPRPPRSPAL